MTNPNPNARPATVVLVHGAWHGPWCWERVTSLLTERGVPFVLVDRGVGSPRQVSSDPWVDRERVQAAVRAVDGPVVLLGHSQGGIGITFGGVAPNVKRLVYLTAHAPGIDMPEGVVLRSPALVAGGIDTPEGRVFDAATVGAVFYGDCSPEDVAWAVSRLDPQQILPPGPLPEERAWQVVPSTYVVCTEDAALLAAGQRVYASHMTEVVEWPTSHSPFLSQPVLVADLLERLAREHCD
ncbi:MAG: alpha/beta hydrolase [Dehalococcoidia bacterium]